MTFVLWMKHFFEEVRYININSPFANVKQKRHNANKLALFALGTKQKGNVLLTNDLNHAGAKFGSANRATVVDDRAHVHIKSDTVKLSPFQDNNNIDLEDVCDSDIPDLDITTITIATLCSGLNFLEGSITSDVIQTVIYSITSQAIIPAEQALGKFTRRN